MKKSALFLLFPVLAAASFAGAKAPALQVVATTATGSMPKAVTVSPDGKHLVVTNFGFWKTRNVYWYDPQTLQKIDQTDFNDKDGNAVEAVFSPDSKTVYVSNFNGNKIEVIDTATHKVTRSVDVGLRPKITILSKDGTKMMVANWDSYSATIYDTSNFKLLYKLKANEHPRGIALTNSGKAYIAGFEGDELDIYDGTDFTNHKKVKACKHVRHMTLSPDEKTLYLSCYYLGQLGVWDVATDKMKKLVQIGQEPKSSAVSSDGRWVFIANFGAPDLDSVSVVDTTDWTQRFVKVPKMDQGCGLSLSPDQKTVWVTGWSSRTVHAIDVSPLGIGTTTASATTTPAPAASVEAKPAIAPVVDKAKPQADKS
jgi:YVTN family beta-propeller protein